MDRPPPDPGTGGDTPPDRPGRYADDPDRTPPTGYPSLAGLGAQPPAPQITNGPPPPTTPGPAGPGRWTGGPADPMPTTPIPRMPGAGPGHPATPGPVAPRPGPPNATAPPYTSPGPAYPEPHHRTSGYPPAPPEAGPPGDFAPGPPATEPDRHDRYEGNWADWMSSPDGYPPRPAGAAADPYTPATAPATPDDGPPDDDRAAAEPRDESGGDAPDNGADTAPATARERLRARLTPRETAAPLPANARTPNATGRSRLSPVLLGAAGIAALGAAAYVQFAVIGAGEPAPASTSANPPASAAPSDPPAADPTCPAERVGNTVQGNGPGNTGSGTEAIFGFQHAYYVTRSGEQARTLAAPDAALPPADDIQRGIDTIPAGTTHCLRITPGAFVGQYTVVVTEHRPGAAPLEYNPQLVTTMRIGDRTLITGIGPMP